MNLVKKPGANVFFICLAFIFLSVFSLFLSSCGKKAPEPSEPSGQVGPGAPGQNPGNPEENPPKELGGLLFVSIGNNPTARPQTGLGRASLVFEAPAEGGITRIFAGFTEEIDKIGPVRSARKCLVQVAVGFGAPFAHCGGSQDSFQIIRHEKTKSLDDIYSAGECFWRTDDRSAPDNLYTSTEKIVKGAKNRGFSLAKFPFKFGDNLGQTEAIEIEHNFSKLKDYPDLVSYTYADGKYLRSINSKPHVDSDGNQIAPSNLVFLEVETSYPKGKIVEIDMNVQGQGKCLYFTGGKVFEGTWKKASLHEPIEFFLDGKDFLFSPGMIWVHLVPDISQVDHTAQKK